MRTLARRVTSVAAGVCLAAVCAAAPASADGWPDGHANGTFFYQSVLGGSGTITDPILGNCYNLGPLASSGFNNTDAVATVYTDGYCSLFGSDVNPGDNVSVPLFAGVVFRQAR